MWKTKTCAIILFLLLLVQPLSASASSYLITDDQLNRMEMHLQELEKNNNLLSEILNESDQELTKALNQLQKLKEESAKLKSELQAAKAESEKAIISLEIANQELQNASASYKKLEAQKRRCENQRTIWQILAAIAAGVAIAR